MKPKFYKVDVFFLIDGYNLLFSWEDEVQSLQKQREKLCNWLQKKFKEHHFQGKIVFDGSFISGEISGHGYQFPLEIIYTPSGQSADLWLTEYVERIKNRKELIVVSNDNGLKRHIQALHAKIISNQTFLKKFIKKTPIHEKKTIKISENEVERLKKIFEERLKSSDSDFES